MPPGATAKLSIVRDGKDQEVSLTIGDMPKERQAKADIPQDQNESPAALGLSLAPADSVDGLSGPGVAVTQVDPDGPAADHGFKVGDVILEVNGSKVSNPGEVKKAIASAKSGGKRTVLMRVKSGDQTRFVAVPVNNA
jgi:serine protease Do